MDENAKQNDLGVMPFIQRTPPQNDTDRLAREFWERCVLAMVGAPVEDSSTPTIGTADFLTAAWRERFAPGTAGPKREWSIEQSLEVSRLVAEERERCAAVAATPILPGECTPVAEGVERIQDWKKGWDDACAHIATRIRSGK